MDSEIWRSNCVQLDIIAGVALVGISVSAVFASIPAGTQYLLSFDPIFVIPAAAGSPLALPSNSAQTPGRRTGTGSAAISSPSNRPSVKRVEILGFKKVSLLSIISQTGEVPHMDGTTVSTLEEIQRSADRPVVVFPECTTSNGRGLMRFADIFKGRSVPTKNYKVFIMCAR